MRNLKTLDEEIPNLIRELEVLENELTQRKSKFFGGKLDVFSKFKVIKVDNSLSTTFHD